MIFNATLLRVDLPAPSPTGATISVRCTLIGLTAEQQRVNDLNAWGATLVMYIPLRRVPSPRPVVSGQVLIRDDDEAGGAGVLYDVKQIVERKGQTLGHIQVYVAPVP